MTGGLKSLGCLILVMGWGLSSHSQDLQIGESNFKLAAPTLTGKESDTEKAASVLAAIRGLTLDQFARESIVAPVRIQLRYLRDAGGTKIGHDIHALFIVHTELEQFSPESFADRLSSKRDPSKRFIAKDPTEESLSSLGLTGDEKTKYKVATFDLMDKIRLTGLFELRTSEVDDQRRVDFRVVDEHFNRWHSTVDPSVNGEYQGLIGHLTMTRLGVDENQILVELRLLMREPSEWFAGSNFLRSKLPLVLQEMARDIRRSLRP